MFSYFEWKDKERVDRKLVSHLITIWRKYLNCLLSYNFPFWYAQKLANVSMALFVWVIFMYRFNYIPTYLIHHQQVRSEISNCFNSPLQMRNHYVLLLLGTSSTGKDRVCMKIAPNCDDRLERRVCFLPLLLNERYK